MTEFRRNYFDCDCAAHAVSVSRFDFDHIPIISVEWWVNGGEDWSLRERLRYAWEILRYSKLLVREVVLTPEDARRMGDALIEVAGKTDDEQI